MAFLLLVLAVGASADYYMPQVPPQDIPMPTIPPPPPPMPVPQTPYQPEPAPTLPPPPPPTAAPDVPAPPTYQEHNYATYAPQPTPTLPPPPPPTAAPDVPAPPSYQQYNYAPQPVPTLPPFVPDVRPCDLCPAVHTNFNPALTRTANCRALGLDLADYEILSAMSIDTTTSTTCQKTIQCSDYATDTIWIGTHQGQFGCWHDNVRTYLTTCQDGKFIDQDGDHIVSLVCLKKAIRPTPAPIQPQPQPYYTAAPQPLPTLPPVIPTQAPDVPQANGYSGY